MIVEKMAETLDEKTLTLKVVEECMELSEVLVKRVTKSDELKPPVEKIIEEAGDLLFRLDILMEKLGIHDQVYGRFQEKGEQIAIWFKKKYEN